MTDADLIIASYINRHPGCTLAQIAEGTMYSYNHTARVARRLVDEGHVLRMPREPYGHYAASRFVREL
jgi:DNA-binding MarR family transcriptional regulator